MVEEQADMEVQEQADVKVAKIVGAEKLGTMV